MKKTTKAKKSTSRTAKKATAAQKQNKLDSLNLSDGKLEVEKVRELEQLLGVDQVNAFKTNNLDVFQDNLSEMSLTDLQRLAAEAGVFPGGNKMALKNRLLKEFVSQTKGRRAAMGSQKPIIDPSDPKFEEVKKLMSEGM
ncbi:MAG TPA: hypothetical protein DF712_00085 [Balneola sp.]|jgi:hypothetical protein|nr:hypothetical protein [Balneola sp.]|tara:strand:- start:1467 stop:1886 length:420 start_codon:yes stop_codon:yes gene_type:complete